MKICPYAVSGTLVNLKCLEQGWLEMAQGVIMGTKEVKDIDDCLEKVFETRRELGVHDRQMTKGLIAVLLCKEKNCGRYDACNGIIKGKK